MVVLLLGVVFLFPFILYSSLFTFQLSPPLIVGAWLIFGLLCVSVGTMVRHILHPEQLTYQQVLERCSQMVRETSDQEVLLDCLADTLYKTLGLENLSVWRYYDEDRILTLLRLAGDRAGNPHAGRGDLTELPVDVELERLHGIWLVSALPESALRRGLMATGAQVITSLSLGGELVGLIGLGSSGLGSRYNREMLAWLDLMAGQLALVVKNAYLITDLAETLGKLQRAYRGAIDAEEEERHRLAIELHDDILSRLTTMTLTLRTSQNHLNTDPGQVQGWLEMLETETRSVNRRLREITQGLYPSVLADLGLISALRAYIDSLAKQSLPTSTLRVITLTAQGFGGERLPEQKLERDLYYVTRQALDNAVAHAQTEQIFIHLRWREDGVSITVQDTGCGMKDTPDALMGQNGHLGLLSMNERVLAWQGRLNFRTAPNQGTAVHVHIPIDQPSSAPTDLQAFTQYLEG